MNYLKMDVGLSEPIFRTIFFNPDDRYHIDSLVNGSDIKKVETKWISLGYCVITPDIEVEVKIQVGQTTSDFISNEMTVVAFNYFK